MLKKAKWILNSILQFLSPRERAFALGILVLMVIGTLIEGLGIALILPFIKIVSAPQEIHQSRWLELAYTLSHVPSEREFLILVSAFLIALYLLKNTYFAVLYKIQNRFSFRKRVELSTRLLSFYLNSPYEFHLKNNSAHLIRNIDCVSAVIDGILIQLMILSSEIMIMVAVLAILFLVQPLTTIMAIILVGGSVSLFYRAVKHKVRRLGEIQFQYAAEALKYLQQSLGGVKETKVLGRERFFLEIYQDNLLRTTQPREVTQTISQLPKLFTEAVVAIFVVGFIMLSLLLHQPAGSLIPKIALFALAAFRLMPSINRILGTTIMIRQCIPALDYVHRDFQLLTESPCAPLSKTAPVVPFENPAFTFNSQIRLENVSFSYARAARPAINQLTLQIARGQSVGFVGQSGAGKTTLMDLLLGLLRPTAGEIWIDRHKLQDHLRQWQSKVGYIAQQIYLSDDTFCNNIAFGIPPKLIDMSRIREVVRIAQLEEFVRELPQGLDTFIGERGVRLSGGQRQRIGIARALYHDPEILIFDEATASLDNQTESEISSAIERLRGNKTIIIVAHRLTTVMRCDVIFFMRDGRLLDQGSFEHLIGNNPDFRKLALAYAETKF